MGNVIITEENFKKAHKQGSAETKKTLENLAPEVFKSKFPAWAKGDPSGCLYLFLDECTAIMVTEPDGRSKGSGKIGEIIHDKVHYSSQIPIKGIREIE